MGPTLQVSSALAVCLLLETCSPLLREVGGLWLTSKITVEGSGKKAASTSFSFFRSSCSELGFSLPLEKYSIGSRSFAHLGVHEMANKRREFFSNAEFIMLFVALCSFIAFLAFGVSLIAIGSSSVMAIVFFVIGGGIFVGPLLFVILRIRKVIKEEEKDRLVVETLSEERQQILRNLIQRYNKIRINEMAKLLDFANRTELQKWLLTIPPELEFYLEGEEVIIPREKLSSGTDEAEEAIETLLRSFEEFKKKREGKI